MIALLFNLIRNGMINIRIFLNKNDLYIYYPLLFKQRLILKYNAQRIKSLEIQRLIILNYLS